MRLKLELLSDTLPASGESLSAVADIDVVHDAYGLPLIPARRLRGLLREAAEELAAISPANYPLRSDLFGEPGQTEGSGFQMDNGQIEHREDWIGLLANAREHAQQAFWFNPTQVLDHFTTLRAQTAIEGGQAKPHSLRRLRLLKKGVVFLFPVRGVDDNSSRAYLDAVSHMVRAMGIGRTRGLGEVKLSVEKDPLPAQGHEASAPSATTAQPQNQGSTRQLLIRFRNLAPLLINQQVGRRQTSESHIPGTLLQGVLAGRFIRVNLQGKPPHQNGVTNPDFHRLFVSGGAQFQNAYPVAGTLRATPAPLSLLREKHTENYFDLASATPEQLAEKALKGRPEGYLAGPEDSAGCLQGCYVEMAAAYHHRRAQDRAYGRALDSESPGGPAGDRGEFFQFEVIAADQEFEARISGPDQDVALLKRLLDDDPVFSLGKSKSAEYGSCRLSTCVLVEGGELEQSDVTWKTGECLAFELHSDTLLANEHGLTLQDPDLFCKAVASRLGAVPKDLQLEKTFVLPVAVGGYMAVWSLPRVQQQGLAAGSVFVLKNHGKTDLTVKDVGTWRLGLRTAEGFGRVCLSKRSGKALHIDLARAGERAAPPLPAVPIALRDFTKRRYRAAWEGWLEQEAREKAEKVRPPGNSFLARLRGVVLSAPNFQEFKKITGGFRTRSRESLERIGGLVGQQGFRSALAKIRKEQKELLTMMEAIDPGLRAMQPQPESDYSLFKVYAEALITEWVYRNRRSRS